MKFILLAAAAVIATPLMAQDMAPPADQTMPAPDGTAPADTMTPQAPPADSTMPAPMTDTAPMAPASSMPAPTDPNATDPTGGYQPSAPPMQGTPMAGQPVQFQPAPTPDQAYPAPPPLKSYPVCKKGQYDNCKNAGGR